MVLTKVLEANPEGKWEELSKTVWIKTIPGESRDEERRGGGG